MQVGMEQLNAARNDTLPLYAALPRPDKDRDWLEPEQPGKPDRPDNTRQTAVNTCGHFAI